MKISTNGITNASLQAKESVPGITSTGRDASTDSIMQSMDLYIPSPEWLRIQESLHRQPEVRTERVAVASERLNVGYYLTPESAQATAEAMIHSLD